jgi:outer membrane protein assembly factor BamB
MCSSLLAIGDSLIVNPGAKESSLVALDRHTGEVVWRSSGAPAAYASFIVAQFGGVQQIVGYDALSLGGWDAKTGKRLWKLVPPQDGDYNVPTPIAVDGKLLVSTENNGTRLHDFDRNGEILAKPIAVNDDLVPDSSTPVVLKDKVLGCPGRGELFCLDVQDLKTLWTLEDDGFDDYASLIGSGDRLLVTTSRGELLLLRVTRDGGEILSRVRLLGEGADVYSHPAIVNDRLYIRAASSIYCVRLEDSPVASSDPAGS